MNKVLSTMLNGLSAQYAGEYLSPSDKNKSLNNQAVENRLIIPALKTKGIQADVLKHEKRHIAMLCNDATHQNVIQYILGNANDCSIDILYHGAHKTASSGEFYSQARHQFSENNVDVSIVKLISDSIDEIKDYLMKHRSLQYLVTDSDDKLIGSFLKNKSITDQLQIPIVLIN